ncbi:MAG: hypothetical protein KA264_06955 [Crocinitomicaceae bacterium]|nr:hypothetical protein [Crocinitomicaceae bacterium]
MNRIRNARYQLKDIMDVLAKDQLSPKENVILLREELAKHYNNNQFLKCEKMVQIVRIRLKNID